MPRPEDIADLVREALEMPEARRPTWLRARCHGDPDLLAAAERAVDEQLARTIQGDAGPAPSALARSEPRDRGHPTAHGVADRLGNYRVLSVLGEGGMGVVYLAEQERPRRTVALKVIRPGLLTPKVLRRFELETQTMARLQHPGIAQVYDAGAFEAGIGSQPYFAMEFVAGRTLNAYAESERLAPSARIALFNKVCDAVQHAHQRGVIHRDLKSSNILVTPDGTPKVLDFGVAKITDADGSGGATLRTDAGQIVGTVPYMSPEQIAGRPEDIDTRSDVYTLGVVLFELLTGRLPHAVGGRTLVEASRIIADQDAPRLGSLSGEFRGDLEVIVAKAIDKDRERRYQSPAELAADLNRYLNDEPILARPPSTVYLLRKFARRNRPVVVAGAAAVALLILGAAGVSWQAVEATRGRSLAETMRAAADTAKQAAVKEARTATEINSLLTEMLQSADPDVSLGREITVLEVLDRTAANLGDAVNDPEVVASVRSTLSATYQNLNKLDKAETQARLALELLDRERGRDAAETLEAMRNLANILADQGRFDLAEPLARESLERTVALHGQDSAATVSPIIVLSRVLHESGQMKEAADYLDRALRIAQDQLGDRHPDTLYAMHNKASALKDDGRFDEAIELFRRVITLRREVYGPTHSQTLSSMNNLAGTLQKAGRNEESLEMFREIYELRRKIFGDDHAATLTTLSNMAVCYVAMKRPDDAEPLLRKALEGYARVVGETHNKTLITMANLAYLEEDRGHVDEAERLYRRVIQARTQGQNPNEPELLAVMNNLAMMLLARGDAPGAARVFEDLLSRAEQSMPKGHYLTAIFANNYGECLTTLGRYTEAKSVLDETTLVLEKTLGANHPRVVKAHTRQETLEAASSARRTVTPPASPGPSPAQHRP